VNIGIAYMGNLLVLQFFGNDDGGLVYSDRREMNIINTSTDTGDYLTTSLSHIVDPIELDRAGIINGSAYGTDPTPVQLIAHIPGRTNTLNIGCTRLGSTKLVQVLAEGNSLIIPCGSMAFLWNV
jgi:hypothetical protein